jgi:hypothetical protein
VRSRSSQRHRRRRLGRDARRRGSLEFVEKEHSGGAATVKGLRKLSAYVVLLMDAFVIGPTAGLELARRRSQAISIIERPLLAVRPAVKIVSPRGGRRARLPGRLRFH